MTITAQEVCIHAAPIAALLGVTELDSTAEYVHLRGLNGEDETLGAQNAAALLLGLIVAKSKTFEAMEYRAWSGIDNFVEYKGERSLESVFIAACSALARAHGLSPAHTKEAP